MSPRCFALILVLHAAAPAGALPVPPNWPSKEAVIIFRECSLPPATPNEKPLDFAATPFPAAALKGYPADISFEELLTPENREKFGLRVEVVEAFAAMRVYRGESRLRTDLPAMPTEVLKKTIAAEQTRIAHVVTKLELALSQLDEHSAGRAKEPKRWQVHYDYAVAQLKFRLAFQYEYNLTLAHVRTDLLPNLDPAKGQTGYRLAWNDKMQSNKSVRELADEARERFRAIAAEHPNTPWAALAQRCIEAPIGLRWEPNGEKK